MITIPPAPDDDSVAEKRRGDRLPVLNCHLLLRQQVQGEPHKVLDVSPWGIACEVKDIAFTPGRSFIVDIVRGDKVLVQKLPVEVVWSGDDAAGCRIILGDDDSWQPTMLALLTDARYRELVESAPIGIFQSTPQGRYLSANSHLAAMYGYETVQDLLESVHDIRTQVYVDPEERDRLEAATSKGYIDRLEIRRRRRDGSVIWVALSARAVRDQNGAVLRYDGFASDITKHKLAEEALRSESTKLRALMETATDGIHILDKDGNLVQCSPSFAEMLGYSMEEMHRLNVTDWDVNTPAEELIQQVRDHILTPKTFETRHKCKDGSVLDVEISARDVEFDGKVFIYNSARDITQRKLSEELRDRVDSIIQHDLRAPVGSAFSVAQLLRESESLTKQQRQLLESFEASATQMLDTLNSSMDLYKIEMGQHELSLETFDCVTVIRNLVQTLAKKVPFAEIRLEALSQGIPVSMTDFHCLCSGRPYMLRTAVQNLLLNALEASPPNSAVTVKLSVDMDCCIEIRNFGTVPPEIRERFFEKYATRGKPYGTGLGTYSAKMMITAMGGDITMHTSDQDNETVVTVRMPC